MKTFLYTLVIIQLIGFKFFASATNSGIDLISFEATQNNEKVDIKWITKTENNASLFVVEKSTDGKNFQEVLKMNGAGKQNFYMEYFDADYQPAEGLSYYRIKQVTSVGEEIIHGSIAVNFFKPHVASDVEIMQNPDAKKQELNLLLKGFEGKEVLVVLRNKKGEEFYSKVFLSATAHYLAALDPERHLPAGEYLITASHNDKIYSKKIHVR